MENLYHNKLCHQKKIENRAIRAFWINNLLVFLPYDKNGQNPAQRPKNGPPSDQTATYRKTEVIQSYLRIWGTYDPIESGP